MEEIRELQDVEEHYEVLCRIGFGGQADLFAGRERMSGRKVAIKIQRPWLSESARSFGDLGMDLVDEGSRTHTLAAVPEVPNLFARGWYHNRRCLVMEFVDGKLLNDVLLSARPVKDTGTVASVVGQLCEILHRVHALEMVHCDLKPENVLVEQDGRIRLIDMGLAIAMRTPIDNSRGTPGFMAPEQFDKNPKGLTGRSDIFALGCILMEMTVMWLPYGGAEERPTLGQPVLPPDRLAALPVEFRDLALRMVARETERRPLDVAEVFAAVRPFLPSLGSRRPAKPLHPDPAGYYRTFRPTL